MNTPSKKSNRLAKEKSPYLLQHAHNPVDWYSFGEEAFAKAKSEDKPILLSIGYATCHWCHVMERESFEDEETANYLNEHFVAIKVDREERPDVDAIYMRALHATGQHGGWPLNMFLTTDLRPITGGTYFPPKPAYGRPSFLQVLQTIADLWKKDRAKMLESADSLTGFLQTRENQTGNIPDSGVFAQAASHFRNSYDELRGGFLSNGPNKFPPSLNMLFLLRHFEHTGDESILALVENTCDAMKRGGIYDQIGGGLSRYATDHDWLVPHFEKMLYDNALFARVLTETYRITGNERYKTWALDIFEYVARDLTSPDGAFYSAEDADSEGKEGLFYLWSADEIDSLLKEHSFSAETRKQIARFYGVSMRGNFEGKNILHESSVREEFLRAHNLKAAEWEETIGKVRHLLLLERSKRIRPLRDDKVLTAWNALMISALARAGAVFGDAGLTARAEKAAAFIESHMVQGETILRRFREGEARFEGSLQDYAGLAISFIDLYQTTFRAHYITRAMQIAQVIATKFKAEGGGFFDTADGIPDLLVRSMEIYDGVEPSGNALAAMLFGTLARYGYETCGSVAEEILARFGGEVATHAPAHCMMLLGLDLYLNPPHEVAIVDGSDALGDSILAELRPRLSIGSIIARGEDQSIPLLKSRKAEGGKTTVYVCRNFVCDRPVHSAAEALALL